MEEITMEAITVSKIRTITWDEAVVAIYYHKGRTFTKEALIKFLNAYGYTCMKRGREFEYHTDWGMFEEEYAPVDLESDEICLVELTLASCSIYYCPDYFLLDKVE